MRNVHTCITFSYKQKYNKNILSDVQYNIVENKCIHMVNNFGGCTAFEALNEVSV